MADTIKSKYIIEGIGDFSDIQNKIKDLQDSFNKLSLPVGKKVKFTEIFGNLDSEMKKFQDKLDKGFNTKRDFTEFEKNGKTIFRLLAQLQATAENTDLTKAFPELANYTKQIKALSAEVARLGELKKSLKLDNIDIKVTGSKQVKEETLTISETLQKLSTKYTKKEKIIDLKNLIDAGDIDAAKSKIEELQKSLHHFRNPQNKAEVEAWLQALVEGLAKYENEVKKVDEQTNKVKQSINDLKVARENASKPLQTEIIKQIGDAGEAVREYTVEVAESERAQKEFNDELENLGQRAKYFFGIAGAARLVRQAIRELWKETQELDKSMTETAVVTDFTVGDMWEKLPEYTQNAKALGVATKELYDATTLYYQQGLKGNEVMNIGVETLKLARISGLEAAQATDLMTTALRGFNMEINETSAQNISDTYAALAAGSASNVQELATAMSKTASLAASVGADFKNIAVFLAQGIETTRESADTVGTAMKTVLARFNEMKKDPAEIMDVDGETVDVNKVETALRSAGIALRDTNGQFREADKVLLEVAEKWNSMSIMQQRYIATQAAGSRQQSRFIAMMSDYNRTLELQQMAYNSTGAAEKQFEKTQDSLQTKVQRLKDTWQQFILGLANDKIIKGVVDAFNGFLDIINKLSGLPGILGSISKGLLAFGAFKGGRKIFDGLLKAFSAGNAAKMAEGFSKGFIESLEKSLKATGNSLKNKVGEIFRKNFWVGMIPPSNLSAQIKEGVLPTIETIENKLKNPIQFQLDDYEIDDLSERLKRLNEIANLSSEQQLRLNAAIQAGIAPEEALNAINEKYTKQYFQKLALQELGNEATEEEVKAKITEMMATYGQTTAEKTGLLTKIRYNLQALFGTKKAREEAAAKLQQAGSTWAAKFAQDAFNTSLAASPIGWITVGILALVIAMVALTVATIKYVKENSLDYKLEQIGEAAKEAKDVTEKTSQAYDDLLDKRDNFKEMQEGLNGLIKGTQEWNNALIKNNQEVLKLIEEYPKLAQYMSTDANGTLTISPQGFQEYGQELLDRAEVAQRVQQQLQIDELELRASAVRHTSKIKQYDNTFLGSLEKFADLIADFDISQANTNAMISSAIAGQEIIPQLNYASQVDISERIRDLVEADQFDYVKLLKKNEDDFSKSLYDLVETLGFSADKAEEIYKEVDALQQEDIDVKNYENSIKAIQNSLFSSADFLKSADLSQYKDSLSHGLAVIYNDNFEDAQKEALTKLASYSDDQLISKYKELTGKTKEEIEEAFDKNGKLDTKKLKEAVSRYLASDDLQNTAKDIANRFERFVITAKKDTEDVERLAAALFNPEDLTQAYIDNLVTNSNKYGINNTTVEGFAQELGYKDVEEMAEAFGIEVNELYKKIKDGVDKAQESIDDAKKSVLRLEENDIFSKVGKEETGLFADLTKGLTAAQIKGLSDATVKIYSASGASGAEAFLTSFQNLLNDKDIFSTTELKNSFISAFNQLDLSDVDSIRQFSDSLEAVKVHIPNDKISAFESELIKLAGAVKQVNLENLKKQIESLQKLVNSIEEKDFGDRSFTQEEAQQIIQISNGAITSADFVGLGNNLTYVGNSVYDLIPILKQKMQQELTEQRNQLNKDIEAGETIEAARSTYIKEHKELSANVLTWNPRQQLDFLKSLDPTISGISTDVLNLIQSGIVGNFKNAKWKDEVDTGLVTMLDNAMDSVLSKITNLDDNIIQRDMADQQLGYLEYMDKSTATVTKDMISSDPEKEKAATNAMIARAHATGVLEGKIQAVTNAQKTYKDIQKGIIKGDEKEAKAALESAKTELAKHVALKETQASLNKTREATEDYFKILESDTSSDSEKESALSNIITAAKDYLGLNISEKFLKDGENLENFKKMLESAPDSDDGLIKWFKNLDAETKVSMLGFGEWSNTVLADGTTVANYINNLDPELLVTGEADFTQIVTAMANMAGQAFETEEEIRAFLSKLSGLGVDFDIEYEYKEVDFQDVTDKMLAQMDPRGASALSSARRQGATGKTKIKLPKITAKFKDNNGGGGDSSAAPASTSSGGGGSDSSNTYEPDVDPLYNEKQKLLKLENDRTKAESEYNKELAKETPNVQKLVNLYNQITETNRQRLEQTKLLRDATLQEISDLENTNSDLLKYAHYDENTHTVYQDVNAIAALKGTDEEFGNKLDEYIKKLEEFASQYNEYDQGIDELEQEILEREKRTNEVFERHLNELAELAAKEKEANKLQDEYNAILRRRVTRSQDLYKNQQEQLVVMDDIIKSREKYLELVQTDWNSYYEEKVVAAGAQNVITFDENVGPVLIQEELERLSDSHQQIFKDIFDRFKERFDDVISAQEELAEAEKKRSEFLNDSLQSALEGIAKIRELIVAEYQEAIDSLSTVNESINSSNSKLLDGIQKNISQLRQDRENEKTEKDLRDKEAQLTYLMQDTTGANLQKIKELQEQLDEGKQSYTDTLIDQKISELQEQNDEAAEQRQEQIDLMTDWLDLYQKSGLINKEIQEVIAQGLGEQGEVIVGSRLDELIKQFGVQQGLTKDEFEQEVKPIKEDMQNITQIYGNDIENGVGPLMDDYTYKSSDARRALRIAAKLEEPTEQDYERFDLDEDGKISAADAQYILKMAARLITRSDIPKKRYATGGLADYTGPAWLDGTSTNPELVLNAQDTQNFIMLKDILASILNSTSGVNAVNSGDNYFDIHIEVEKIESDYDVDQMADRIKNIIRDDAMYRNVNIINQW